MPRSQRRTTAAPTDEEAVGLRLDELQRGVAYLVTREEAREDEEERARQERERIRKGQVETEARVKRESYFLLFLACCVIVVWGIAGLLL